MTLSSRLVFLTALFSVVSIAVASTQGQADGDVGVRLGAQGLVQAVTDKSAAARAGLAAGDRILKIDGTPTVDLSSERASPLLRGAANSKVMLTIQPAGMTRQLELTLVREPIAGPANPASPLPRRYELPPPEVAAELAELAASLEDEPVCCNGPQVAAFKQAFALQRTADRNKSDAPAAEAARRAWQTVIDEWRAALAKNLSAYDRAHFNYALGYAYARLGQYPAAMAAFEQTVNMDAWGGQARVSLAAMQYIVGRRTQNTALVARSAETLKSSLAVHSGMPNTSSYQRLAALLAAPAPPAPATPAPRVTPSTPSAPPSPSPVPPPPLEMKNPAPAARPADSRSAAEILREAARTRDEKPIRALIAQGTAAVPDLSMALVDADPAVRGAAAVVLGQVDPVASPAVRVVAGALRDGTPVVRAAAVTAMGAMLGRATTALVVDASVMVPLLSDAEKPVRNATVAAFQKLGPKAAPALPALWTALNAAITARSDDQRDALAPAIVATGPAAFPSLMRYFATGATTSFNFSLVAKGIVAMIGAPAVPDVVAVMQDARQPEFVRKLAVETLQTMGPAAVSAIPVLRPMLSVPYPREPFGHAAGIALGKIGSPAIPALIAALQDANEDVRKNASSGLAAAGSAGAPAVSALIAALADTSTAVRENAAEAIGNVGLPAAAAAKPSLLEAFRTNVRPSETSVRLAAVLALSKLDGAPDDAIPFLVQCVDTDKSVGLMNASRAAMALGNIGPRAKSAVPSLRRLVDRNEPILYIGKNQLLAVIRKIEGGL